MLEIVFNKVKRNFGYKDVLRELSFEVLTGDRMAIIGANGYGKTTALKIIAGEERIDSGLITMRSGATIGYLQQTNHKVNEDITVNDFIKTGQMECLKLENKLQELIKEIEAMKSSIKQLRDFGNRSGNEKFFKRVASIQKRLEKLDVIEKPTTTRALFLDFELKNRSGKDVITIEELSLTIGDRNLIEGGNINIYYGDKVCILGKNGTGKSTLLKAILGHLNLTIPLIQNDNIECLTKEIEITASKFKVGESVKIGYISQEISFEDENSSILKIFQDYCVGTETLRRTKLSRFRFIGEDVFKKVSSLSGGEGVKLRLACLMEQEVNCIVLDEPTNHIDIDTREVLEDALKDYKGTLIFVTHDRYFTNTLAKKIIAIEDGIVTTFVGNYDDYKDAQGQ